VWLSARELIDEVVLGVAVLGEDKHPAIGPAQRFSGGGGDTRGGALVGADPREQRRELGVQRLTMAPREREQLRHQRPRIRRWRELASPRGIGGDLGEIAQLIVDVVLLVERVARGNGRGRRLGGRLRVIGEPERAGVCLERASKRRHAREQPLLQIHEHQPVTARARRHQRGVLGEQPRQLKLWRVAGRERQRHHFALRKAIRLIERAQIRLQPPDHDLL
jgi:hypothetical protein